MGECVFHDILSSYVRGVMKGFFMVYFPQNARETRTWKLSESWDQLVPMSTYILWTWMTWGSFWVWAMYEYTWRAWLAFHLLLLLREIIGRRYVFLPSCLANMHCSYSRTRILSSLTIASSTFIKSLLRALVFFFINFQGIVLFSY